jgi:hypothetical protein
MKIGRRPKISDRGPQRRGPSMYPATKSCASGEGHERDRWKTYGDGQDTDFATETKVGLHVCHDAGRGG